MTKFELDLDALVKQPAMIHYKGKEIKVNEPSVEDIIRIMHLNEIIKDNIEENIAEYITRLNEIVNELVPELNEEKLNTKQLNAIVEMLMSMVQTEEEKQLSESGVEVSNPKEKAAS